MTSLPQLSRALLADAARATDIAIPTSAQLALPERAIQFGTGAFLRGFVEYFVDRANEQGIFNGRIVAVGSTGSGRDRALSEQDGLYTLVAQGSEDGVARESRRVVGALSRALSARDEWDAVLACARNPWLELVFSNTTEVGIALDEGDSFELSPPRSFPGKLTAFLFERARFFAFAPSKGLVVLPCELIEDNGTRLRDIVLAVADRWELGAPFRRWLESSVAFCNTLVDRIVPAPSPADAARLEGSLGYRDALLTVCETYRLFVIEGDPSLRAGPAAVVNRLAEADAGIVVTPDVRPYRERKVRLLNGTHTIMVPLALLAGCETVREAVQHPLVGAFVRRAMLDETVPTLAQADAEAFAHAVLDRFENPFVRHALFDITLQGTMKLRVRVVPTIERHVARTGEAPEALSLGFAAYLLFMRGDLQARRRAAGLAVPGDDQADRLRALWDAHAPGGTPAELDALVRAACADATLWGTDLTRLPGFVAAVRDALVRLVADGVERTLETMFAGAAA